MSQGRIVVVDDTPANLEVIAEILIEAGYTVATAIDGERALKRVQSHPPDLILLDVQMPGMDGFETCQRLKANPNTCQVPVIFITARADIESKEKGFELGAVDYITKPFHEREVLARVKTHVSLCHLQQKLQIANEELQRIANLDGLTQLANRRQFDQHLEQEWRRLSRMQLPLSLIMCDVDFFKSYNDTYGHLAGDECLCKVANILQTAIYRVGDLVARYGGEEFAIILPNTQTVEAIKIAQNIQTAIEYLQFVHTASPVSSYVTLSFGIATMIPTKDMLGEQLIATADRALYQAKIEGRNCIAVFE